jgi:hypothetical protein
MRGWKGSRDCHRRRREREREQGLSVFVIRGNFEIYLFVFYSGIRCFNETFYFIILPRIFNFRCFPKIVKSDY